MASRPEPRTLVALGLDAPEADREPPDAERARERAVRHNRLVRDLLGRFAGREIEKSSNFLLLFERPLDAVAYCLDYHEGMKELSIELALPLAGRAAVHLGEVSCWENSADHIARGAKPLEVEGEGRTTVRRLFSLARRGQTLLTRAVYDLARRAAVGNREPALAVQWLEHGSFRFRGNESAIQLFEVGIEGTAPLAMPRPRDLVAERYEVIAEEGGVWRPEAGQTIPDRPQWILERRLAAGDFGDVWLAANHRTLDRHAFRFCLTEDELPRMQRQLTLLRRLRQALGDPGFIIRPIDSRLDSPPYYLESELVEGELMIHWAAAGHLAELPFAERIELVAGLADAVAAVHGIGAVLGDLQPANLIVEDQRGDQPRRVLITELSSCGLPAGELGGGLADAGIPPPPPYRAPELAADDPASRASDVYALGVLLFQLAAGDLGRRPGPFWQRNVADELVRDDVAALLEPEPEHRLADAAELARRLRSLPDRHRQAAAEARRQEAEQLRHQTEERSRLRRSKLALMAVSLLALAALAILAAEMAGLLR